MAGENGAADLAVTASYLVDMSDDDAVSDYLEQVELVPRLTEREFRELGQARQPGGEADDLVPAGTGAGAATVRAEQVAARGQAARKRLVEGNLRLVVAIAEDYRDQGLSLRELLQAGNPVSAVQGGS